jgi:hypothetical protein
MLNVVFEILPLFVVRWFAPGTASGCPAVAVKPTSLPDATSCSSKTSEKSAERRDEHSC